MNTWKVVPEKNPSVIVSEHVSRNQAKLEKDRLNKEAEKSFLALPPWMRFGQTVYKILPIKSQQIQNTRK